MMRRWAMLMFLVWVPAALAGPTTWWPDVKNGQMWTGEDNGSSVTFDQAQAFCSNLKLDGRTGWRVPTIQELEGVSHFARLVPGVGLTPQGYPKSGDWLGLAWHDDAGGWIWSTSSAGDGKLYTEVFGAVNENHRRISKPTDHIFHYTLCVRPLDQDLFVQASELRKLKIVVSVKDASELQGWVWVGKGEDAYTAGKLEEAITDAQQALVYLPNNPRALNTIGNSQLYLGQFDAAYKTLVKAFQQGGEHYGQASGSAFSAKKQAVKDANVVPAYVVLGKENAAVAAAQYQQAIGFAKQVVDLEPKWSIGYTLWGQSLEALGKFTDEEAVWTQGYRANKDNGLRAFIKPTIALEKEAAQDANYAPWLVQVADARRANRAGDFAKAQTAAKQAIALEPKLAAAFNELGFASGKLQQWELAVSSLQQAVKLDTDANAIVEYQNNLQWALDGQAAAALKERSGGALSQP